MSFSYELYYKTVKTVRIELAIQTHDLSRGLNQDIEVNRFNGF